MTSAASLNDTCACIRPDPVALRAAFPADGAASFGAVSERSPGVFAALPVFVEQAHLDTIRDAVGALHRAALAVPPARDALGPADGPGVLMGYDFHVGDDGPKLIEVNTNAGGALLAARVIEATGNPGFAATIGEVLFTSFVHERQGRPLRTIAIVDERPTEQFLHPEFLLYQELFAARGVDAVIAAPESLVFTDGALRHDGVAIDLVYARTTDFALSSVASGAIRAAWEAGAVTVSPNPHHHATFAHKTRLCGWSDPQVLATLSEPDRALLGRVVPRTVLVDAANADDLWAGRSGWFFKPVAGFGGRATYRGDKLTKGKWSEIVGTPDTYVAQVLVPPGTRRLVPDDTALKVDVRAIAYDGRVQFVFARLYQGQTTNLRTPGGGFAAVLPAPCC